MATSHAPLGEMLELQAQLLLVGSLMAQAAAALQVQTQLARVARSAAAAAAAQLLLVGSLMTQAAAALEVQTQTQLARVARSAAAAARLARVTRAVQLQTQTQLARHPAAHVGPSVAP